MVLYIWIKVLLGSDCTYCSPYASIEISDGYIVIALNFRKGNTLSSQAYDFCSRASGWMTKIPSLDIFLKLRVTFQQTFTWKLFGFDLSFDRSSACFLSTKWLQQKQQRRITAKMGGCTPFVASSFIVEYIGTPKHMRESNVKVPFRSSLVSAKHIPIMSDSPRCHQSEGKYFCGNFHKSIEKGSKKVNKFMGSKNCSSLFFNPVNNGSKRICTDALLSIY